MQDENQSITPPELPDRSVAPTESDQPGGNTSEGPENEEFAVSGRPSRELVTVIVVSTLVSLLTILELSSLAANDRSSGQRIFSGVLVVVGLFVLLASWFAWRAGGYRSLVTKEGRKLLSPEKQLLLTKVGKSTLSAVDGVGSFSLAVSWLAAVVLVIMSISTTPDNVLRITAVVTAASYIGGNVLCSWVKKRQGTLVARADSLGETLRSLSKTTEGARLNLISAATALEWFVTDMKVQFANLERERKAVDEMAKLLQADPAVVASLRQQLQNENRRVTRTAFILWVFGILIAIAIAIAVAIATVPLTDWWPHFVKWYKSL